MPSGPRNVKDIVAAALATGSTIAVAADRGGVSESTVHRWKREDPDFVAKIAELRSAAIAVALGLLSEGMAAAATALVSLVRHRDPDMKLKAAQLVLTLGLKLRDAAEFESRLQAVERALKGKPDGDTDGTADATGGGDGEPSDEGDSAGGGTLPGGSDGTGS